MPELVEVELYRRAAACLEGATITSVVVGDDRFIRPEGAARGFSRRLVGHKVGSVTRHGKVLLIDTTGPLLALRFGMTGVLVVDDGDTLDELVYGPTRRDPAWIRLTLVTDRATVAVRDPRILGSAQLDPVLRLGPDALTVTPAALRGALAGSRTPLKARLLDQQHLAGVGNLIADEVLWRASLAPVVPAGGLSQAAQRRLHRHLRSTVAELLERGGSHLGRFTGERRPAGRCPRCATPVLRTTVGGRTTWWCPAHQKR